MAIMKRLQHLRSRNKISFLVSRSCGTVVDSCPSHQAPRSVIWRVYGMRQCVNPAVKEPDRQSLQSHVPQHSIYSTIAPGGVCTRGAN